MAIATDASLDRARAVRRAGMVLEQLDRAGIIGRIDNSIARVWLTRSTHIATPMKPPRPIENGTTALVDLRANMRRGPKRFDVTLD